ncbi:gas vesicle protein GvpO [Falsibacillus pallidus]|uniref:gas vesicle protein GvpO n=1 Tax=Falsibacillus pallidus TaxID=493781 RepID=UPI003D999CF1
MEIKKVMKTVSDFFQENIAPPHKITSVDLLEEDGWKVTIEVVEEKEYMKKYAKDEMIGIYTVLVNEKGEITSFNRIDIRYRSAIG